MEWQSEKIVVTNNEDWIESSVIIDEEDLDIYSNKESASANILYRPDPESLIMKEGQTLRTVALDLFGNKEFWIYIYLENLDVIKNPNVINVGTLLIIPNQSDYDINPDSPQSVEKAMEKGVTILESF